MIITCPRCFATYNVPDTFAQVGGRKVRCSDCKFTWTETPPPQDAIAALAPEPEPAADTQASSFADMVTSPPPVAEEPKPRPVVRRGSNRPPAPKRDMGMMVAWGLFGITALACALVLLRGPLGKSAHFMTDLYEDIGLPVETPDDWFRFENISLEKSVADGQTVLLVRGQVVNQSRRLREVPQLKLFWLDKSGQEGPMTLLQARPAEIEPDESARFNGELVGVDASAGGEVKVTFIGPDAHETGDTPPAEGAGHEDTSHAAAPHEAPAHETPAHEAPAVTSQDVPAHEAPAHEAPAHEAPVQGAPAHDAPAHETAAPAAPAEGGSHGAPEPHAAGH